MRPFWGTADRDLMQVPGIHRGAARDVQMRAGNCCAGCSVECAPCGARAASSRSEACLRAGLVRRVSSLDDLDLNTLITRTVRLTRSTV